MSYAEICDLRDCTEIRQTVQGRPPLIVHGAVWLIISFVISASVWMGFVRANVVVSAAGRIRPIEQPARVFVEWGEFLDGRVAEVFVKEGDRVAEGQVMLRLDAKRLENEISSLEHRIATVKAEQKKLDQLQILMAEQFRTEKSMALAELLKAEAEIEIAEKRRESLIREKIAEYDVAVDQSNRAAQLRSRRAVTEEEYLRLEGHKRQVEEARQQASLPVETGRLEVLQLALDKTAAEFASRRVELEARRVAKDAEESSSTIQLSNLLLERERSVIRCPIDGVVISGTVRQGEVVELGMPAFEVAREEGFRFEAIVPGTDVGQLRVGMPARIRFDTFDYQTYGTLDGTLCFLSPDSNLATPENKGEAGVHYIIRIDLQQNEVGKDDVRGTVRLGMGGVAEVIVERTSILKILLRKTKGVIRL